MQPKEQRIFEPTLFREYLRSKIVSLLDSIAGRKLLMLEQGMRELFNLIILDRKTYSQHGVFEEDGIRGFEPIQLPNNCDQIMIFLRPNGESLIRLKDLINANANTGGKRYYPCFWPKRTIICKEFFELNGLTNLVDVRDFSFDLLPLDVDLYSLEMRFLKEMYISHDHSIYTTVAESIHRLQCVFGKIHNIYGKGKAAKAIHDILRLKENQIKIDENYGDIESVIILDRSIDYLTPLLRQTVYEGVADEVYGVKAGILKMPSSKFDDGTAKEKKNESAYKLIKLNSEKDYVYEQIKGLSLLGAKAVLKAKSAEFNQFRQQAGRMRDLKEKSNAARRIKQEQECFVTHLNMIVALQEDINTINFHKELMLQQEALDDDECELIEYYENMIPFDIPLEIILRNMAIECIVKKGVPPKIYSKICNDIVFTYGIKHIVSLTHLANLGIFYQSKSLKEPYPYSDIKNELKLIGKAKIDHSNPQDTSFAYGGYTPVAARLVENAIRNGWRLIQKGLKMLPGDTVMPEFSKVCQSHPKPAVVVYFVGGVTYGQIATIRLLGKFLKREIIIATTEIINGDNFIRQLLE